MSEEKKRTDARNGQNGQNHEDVTGIEQQVYTCRRVWGDTWSICVYGILCAETESAELV